jgi:hypothetical protein
LDHQIRLNTRRAEFFVAVALRWIAERQDQSAKSQSKKFHPFFLSQITLTNSLVGPRQHIRWNRLTIFDFGFSILD